MPKSVNGASIRQYYPEFEKKMNKSNGNAFLYILIAVALLAGLTFILSRGQDGGEKHLYDRADVQTRAQRLMSYVNEASQAWLQMQQTGTDLSELDLMYPDDGSFETPPNIHKFFHPSGGGFTYNPMDNATFQGSAGLPTGWKATMINADYTDTSGTDFFLTYMNIDQNLCAKINEMTMGNASIPTATFDAENILVDANSPLTESDCPECATHTSICIEDSENRYVYVNLIGQR